MCLIHTCTAVIVIYSFTKSVCLAKKNCFIIFKCIVFTLNYPSPCKMSFVQHLNISFLFYISAINLETHIRSPNLKSFVIFNSLTVPVSCIAKNNVMTQLWKNRLKKKSLWPILGGKIMHILLTFFTFKTTNNVIKRQLKHLTYSFRQNYWNPVCTFKLLTPACYTHIMCSI